ncbi:MAG TPA: NAD-glutamate dehydrogenase domain-containing protein, partial [Egibacteraceae bacterium]
HDPLDPDGLVRFRLYKAGPDVELSRFLPILESLGLIVVEERLFRMTTDDGADLHLQDFGVRAADGGPIDVEADGDRLAEAAMAIWLGRAEADSLNRLVRRAGIAWDDVAVLRAYRRYRRQVGTSFTEAYQDDALVEWPEVARALVELFAARFDPRLADAGQEAIDAARQRVLDACDKVERLDQDRILRGFLGMIDATLRTNRYREPSADCLALKIDSARVPDMPKPVPAVEIFVYSVDVEGVHLRGGKVARGGIRWSDRQEDFRTEILGLMKAQMVKNAVIVPTGAKGGFVLKRPPSDPQELREAVRRCYETFIRGLLDVTDNVVDGVVVPPPGVRRADGDDPYLVVAADRGTATFSDLANEIAEEYGFWLGDAFASGGSRGYDHKAMGITARGAWVAVQRHFRELDIDVQRESITVVGIGDMSGDVFGNGMLRSDTIKLVAAFDHRDIFLDPDPDPKASFAERRRLFELPRSSWQDYDRSLISEGGGVWSRQAKTVPLSPQVKRLLRVEADELTPPELIRAILRAPVDLLFAGGIGTFVKASTETHADVGDRANDAIRIDANELGARVVGEGGNLAVTQRGRIQYARRGGRINIDAVDNSAGVDTSDREVNLKILLRRATDRGRLDPDERVALLEAAKEDVAAAVLRNVYLQTGTISAELANSPGGMEAYEAFMSELVASGRLDREVEALPSTAEVERRKEAGAGFTRPELAVLLGYAKIELTSRLLDSDLPDQPAFAEVLAGYFPAVVRERFADLLGEHRLRRELIATIVANDLVNRMGITYTSRTASELGCSAAEVAAAYWVAREVAGADQHWRDIEQLDGRVEPVRQLEMFAEVDRLVDAFARSYVRQSVALPGRGERAGIDVAAAVARDRPALHEVAKVVDDRMPARRRAVRDARRQHYIDAGVDVALADRIATLGELTLVPEVAAVARATEQQVAHVAAVFLALSELLPLDRVQEAVSRVDPVGHWERWQQRGLTDDLRQLRREAAARALAEHPDLPPDEAVTRFLAARHEAAERAEAIVARLDREVTGGLAAVSVAVRALREALTG